MSNNVVLTGVVEAREVVQSCAVFCGEVVAVLGSFVISLVAVVQKRGGGMQGSEVRSVRWELVVPTTPAQRKWNGDVGGHNCAVRGRSAMRANDVQQTCRHNSQESECGWHIVTHEVTFSMTP